MGGVALAKSTKIKRAAPSAPKPLLEVTPERLVHAANDSLVVDGTIERAGEKVPKTRRFKDSPIDRMYLRKLITEAQFNAAEKYQELWQDAGRSGRVTANYSPDGGGEARCVGTKILGSERQYQALKKWRSAREAIPAQMVDLVDGVVLQMVMPAFRSGRARDLFSKRIGKALEPIAIFLGY